MQDMVCIACIVSRVGRVQCCKFCNGKGVLHVLNRKGLRCVGVARVLQNICMISCIFIWQVFIIEDSAI